MCQWCVCVCVCVLTVHGHLVDLGTVVLLNVSQDTNVIILHKVDGHAFSPIATRASNSDKTEHTYRD